MANYFIDNLKHDMGSSDFDTRNSANLGLLGYDLGRAKSEDERSRARDEWGFRQWIVCGNSVKETIQIHRKFKQRCKHE